MFGCTWDVLQILAPAQRLAKEVATEIEEIEAGLQRDGIVFQAHGRVVEVPSAMRADKAADFIVRAKKVLARAMELIELFWGRKFSRRPLSQGLNVGALGAWAGRTAHPDA